MTKRRSLFRAGLLSLMTVALALSLEGLLRVFVPLTSLIPRDDTFRKVWYLEHIDSIRERRRHALHVSDEVLGWTHRANAREDDYSTSAQGLRGTRVYSLPRRADGLRVVVLGDSFTAGFGVGDEDPYPAQLERLIPGSEFPNLAVSGYGVDQAILRWERIGRPFVPDLVLLGIFLPDFHRNVGTWWFDAPKPRFFLDGDELRLSTEKLIPMEDIDANERRLREEVAPVLRAPRIWLASRLVLRRLAEKLRGASEPEETFEEKSRILRLLIARLAEDCERRGIELIVMTISDYTPDYPDEDRILSVIAEATKASGAHALRLDRFLGVDGATADANPVFDPKTRHWSANGHRLAAERIADFLRAEGLTRPVARGPNP